MIKITCSKCGEKLEPHRIGKQNYCLKCHAAYMRKNRPKHKDLKENQRIKANCRSYINVYLKRGKITKKSCEYPGCNNKNTQAHHENYSKPLQVIWLCRKHHLQIHENSM